MRNVLQKRWTQRIYFLFSTLQVQLENQRGWSIRAEDTWFIRAIHFKRHFNIAMDKYIGVPRTLVGSQATHILFMLRSLWAQPPLFLKAFLHGRIWVGSGKPSNVTR